MKAFTCNVDGRNRKMTAAKSKKEAANKMGIPYKHMLEYGSATGNKQDIELALNNPDTVYIRGCADFGEWKVV